VPGVGSPVDDAVEFAVLEVHHLEVGRFVTVAGTLAAHRQAVHAALGLVVGIEAERLTAAMARLAPRGRRIHAYRARDGQSAL